MINFKAIGQRVKECRSRMGLTQDALAERLNISVEYMSRIETGNCRASYALIEKMCLLFSIDESELLFGKQNSNKKDRSILEKIERLSPKHKALLEEMIDALSGI